MNEYTAEQAHEAAARGAAWLDKQCPDWVKEIDLATLNLTDVDVCVLGQTAACVLDEPAISRPNYFTVLASISGDEGQQDAWAATHGFKASIRGGTGLFVRYEMLTIAWKELIRERLAVPV